MNIICDNEQFFLIDFDWGGKLKEVCYSMRFYKLNPELSESIAVSGAILSLFVPYFFSYIPI